MSNNIEIEVKDGLVEGDVVILNPRAIVVEARDDDDAAPAVDVKQRFGDAPPPGAAEKPAGPEAGAGEGGRRGGRGGGKSRTNLMQFDKDGDKKVSRDEAPELQAFFDKIDTNGDGFIDAKEAAAAAARRKQMEGGGGGPGGPGGP